MNQPIQTILKDRLGGMIADWSGMLANAIYHFSDAVLAPGKRSNQHLKPHTKPAVVQIQLLHSETLPLRPNFV